MKQGKSLVATKQRRTLVLVISIALVLFAIAYFGVFAQVQANGYTANIEAKQLALSSQTDKLKGLFELDIFTKPNQPAKIIRADAQTVIGVVDGIQKELAASEATLTGFQEYPLLFLNPEYNTALTLKRLETSYVQDIKVAIVDLEAVAAYFDATADIAADIEAGSEAVSAATKLKSIKQMVTAFEIATKSLQAGAKEYETLNPPATLKEYHDISLQYSEGRAKLFEQFVAALKDEDEKKVGILGSQIATQANSGNTQAEKLLKKFVNESTLRKKIDQAEKTSQEIADILKKS